MRRRVFSSSRTTQLMEKSKRRVRKGREELYIVLLILFWIYRWTSLFILDGLGLDPILKVRILLGSLFRSPLQSRVDFGFGRSAGR